LVFSGFTAERDHGWAHDDFKLARDKTPEIGRQSTAGRRDLPASRAAELVDPSDDGPVYRGQMCYADWRAPTLSRHWSEEEAVIPTISSKGSQPNLSRH
jgi:hypothetical protein